MIQYAKVHSKTRRFNIPKIIIILLLQYREMAGADNNICGKKLFFN